MLELLDFIQKYLPIEAFIPLFFVILTLFVRYVYIPWDRKINIIYELVTDFNSSNSSQLHNLHNHIKEMQEIVSEHKSYCSRSCMDHSADIKRILDELSDIEKNVADIVSRLEKAKDDTKDGKIDLNQQLFSIKQDINDLKAKIEPLLFISRGIK